MSSKTAHRKLKANPDKNNVRETRAGRKTQAAVEARKPSTRLANRRQVQRKSKAPPIQNLTIGMKSGEGDRQVAVVGVDGDDGQLSALLSSEQFKQMVTQLSNSLIQEFIDQTRNKIQAESSKVQRAISRIKKPLDQRISLIDSITTQKLESLRSIIDNVLGDHSCNCKTSETTTIEKTSRKKRITKKRQSVLPDNQASEESSDQLESLQVLTFESEPTESAELEPILSQRKLSHPLEPQFDVIPNQMSSDLDCIERNNISCDSIFDQEHSVSEYDGLDHHYRFADETFGFAPFAGSESRLLKADDFKSGGSPDQYNIYSTDHSCRITDERFDLESAEGIWQEPFTRNHPFTGVGNSADEFECLGVDFSCPTSESFPDVFACNQ
jgi:hypothetical protein